MADPCVPARFGQNKKGKHYMITNGKIFAIIFLARAVRNSGPNNRFITPDLLDAMHSLSDEELSDVCGLMEIGRNTQGLGIYEDCYYKTFKEYFADARKEIPSGNKNETIIYLTGKKPVLGRYLYNGYRNLTNVIKDRKDLDDVMTEELLFSVLEKAYSCQLRALHDGRTSLAEEDREEMRNMLSGLSDTEIFGLAGVLAIGESSYGVPVMEAAKDFVSVKDMREYICRHAAKIEPLLYEGLEVGERRAELNSFRLNRPEHLHEMLTEIDELLDRLS